MGVVSDQYNQLTLDLAAKHLHGYCCVWFGKGRDVLCALKDFEGAWHNGAGPTVAASVHAALEAGAGHDPEFRAALDEIGATENV